LISRGKGYLPWLGLSQGSILQDSTQSTNQKANTPTHEWKMDLKQEQSVHSYPASRGMQANMETGGELRYDRSFRSPVDTTGHLYVNAESGLYHCKGREAMVNLMTPMEHFSSSCNCGIHTKLIAAAGIHHQLLPGTCRRLPLAPALIQMRRNDTGSWTPRLISDEISPSISLASSYDGWARGVSP
jgi:hypothetical protein